MGLAGGGAEQYETLRGVSCSSCFNRKITREGESCGARFGLGWAWSLVGCCRVFGESLLCDLWISIVISKGRTVVGRCVLVFAD
jgi:hypothetical protein